MSTSLPRTHRVKSSVELLDAIPYLLGFRPTESLVLVGLVHGVVSVTARLDLADTGQTDLVDETVGALRRGGVEQFLLVVVDDGCAAPPGVADLPWFEAIAAVARAASGVGIDVVEAMLTCRDRWWSYLCDDPRCCPDDGSPVAHAPTAFAAASAYDGVVALPSRAALAATLEPLPAPQRAALDPLISAAESAEVAALTEHRTSSHRRTVVRELLLAARASSAAGWRVPDDTTLARWAAALTAREVRDELWTAIDHRRVDGRPLWAELARRCPEPYDAAALFLLGWCNWRAGNGALASMAAERALLSDPSFSAADLLLAALRLAVDPRTFPPLPGGGDRGGSVTARRRRARRAGAARTPR